MNRFRNQMLKSLPFAGLIVLNILAQTARYNLNALQPVLIVICVVVAINLIASVLYKTVTYFMVGLSCMLLLGTISVLFLPNLGRLFLENVIAALYLGLFMVALLPPILKLDPFTYEYSKKDYPPAVWSTRQFVVINLILNYLWAGFFAFCFMLSLIHYSDSILWQQLLQNLIPLAVILGIGYPVTKKLPNHLQQYFKSESIRFESVREMFDAMPFGLNKNEAVGIDAVIQFELTGDENIQGYFTIKEQRCSYSEGKHQQPTMVIKSPSEIWLEISNGERDGAEALLNGLYSVEGDASLLLKFNDLFSSQPKSDAETIDNRLPGMENQPFQYGRFQPNYIKKILIIDGGGRSEKFSKSTLMARKFCEGAESAGAEVETVNLRNLKIKACCGCYNCWTKTPGSCRYKDDMPALLEKTRQVDLIVYVSPLFVFSVTSRLKCFLDRQIPNLKPYMVKKNGLTHHPARYTDDKEHGFVIFSAGGFPEVQGNFDGVANIFRNMSNHSEKGSLMAEFYLPAAELLSQPVYSERRQQVETICFKAGKQVIEEGRIDQAHMEAVLDPQISQERFQSEADAFWNSLDGKTAYYKSIQPL